MPSSKARPPNRKPNDSGFCPRCSSLCPQIQSNDAFARCLPGGSGVAGGLAAVVGAIPTAVVGAIPTAAGAVPPARSSGARISRLRPSRTPVGVVALRVSVTASREQPRARGECDGRKAKSRNQVSSSGLRGAPMCSLRATNGTLADGLSSEFEAALFHAALAWSTGRPNPNAH